MSGEPGWKLDGERYSIFVGKGISISVEPPPGDDGSYIGRFFEEENAPYQKWLERAQPALDELFAASKLPLVKIGPPFEQVDGAIVEEPDRKAEHFEKYWGGGSLLIHLDDRKQRLDGHTTLRVVLQVKERVKRRALDDLLDAVAEALKKHS